MRRGEFGPAELVESCLRRIDETERTIKAWITVDAESASRQAKALQDQDNRGPLWGIPVGIKDIIDVEGLPTTAASKVLTGNIAEADAPVVAALRGAGAVILGKTNTQEFAYGVVTPPTANPWDTSRIPGGSSGGSAAAVAVSQCLGALGSDTGGSIRIPSALCGIAGIKPRYGVVPIDGVIPLAPSFDAVGPMARTARDLELLWNAVTGTTPASDPAFSLAVADVESLPPTEDEVQKAFEQAVPTLVDMASESSVVRLPNLFEWDVPRNRVLMIEALEVHRSRGWYPEKAHDYLPATSASLEHATRWAPGPLIPGSKYAPDQYPEYQSALQTCRELATMFQEAMGTADVLVTPTLPRLAPTHEEAAAPAGDNPRPPVVPDLTRIPGVANVTGLAALSIVCGFTEGGLPIGLQLVGGDESLLLAVGARYERATGWTSRRPPVVPG